ncbi:MAG TPA: Flp family type IVb pilin [Syntrophomonadaceae bacterium]|nr:Flp family type IVb pilin [Syntrophomonadaceae bacterium]
MREMLRRLIREEEGQGMAEYGLILALIAVVVIGILATMGSKLAEKFQEIVNKL